MNRRIDRSLLASLSPLGLILLASCQVAEQPASGPARFEGVVQSNVSTFNSTSDRCTYSFLFDNFRVEWPTKSQLKPGQATAQTERSFTVAVSPGARGKTAQFDIRGSYVLLGPAPTVRAGITIAGKDHSVTLPDGGESNEFNQRFEAVIANDAELIPVILRTAIDKPSSPDSQVLLDIDSVDLVLVAPNCGSTGTKPKAASSQAPANSS